jgi:membrane protease YdiL (CAAX protease family)
VALTGRAWALVLASLALGFAALSLPVPAGAAALLPALLFPLLPLLALRAVAGPGWRAALFRRLTLRDLGLACGIALANLVVSFSVAALVQARFGLASNPALATLAGQGAGERALFFLGTLPQLLGEELLTVLPLLALLSLLHGHLGWPRRKSLVAAWLLSALPFALAHLPTYQWNLAQCLLVIGSARLVLSLAYLRSRNLAVSTLAHVLNDWLLFAGVLLVGGVAQE